MPNVGRNLFRLRSQHLSRKLRREILEQRLPLATVVWDGGAGTLNWHDELNWDTDQLPMPDDEVEIGVVGGTVVHSQGVTSIESLVTDAELSLTGGSLKIATTLETNATLRLSGGTLIGAIITTTNDSVFQATSADGTLDGVTLAVDTTLLNGSVVTVLNNLTLDGATVRLERTQNAFQTTHDVQLNFSGGSQTLGGTGEVELFSVYNNIDPRHVQVRPTNGGELTIGSGITVRNAANSQFTTLGEPTLPLTIEGTVSAESPGETLWVTGTNVTNLGTLQALAGELDVDNLLGDVNGTNANGGDVDLDGVYTFNIPADVVSGSLTLRGEWTNASTISQQGGTIHLGGDFTIEDLGTDVPTNFSGTGGLVSIFGSLSPGVNDTLLINSERTWQLSGGTITGVTIADDNNGDPLAAFRVTSADGTLDGVTLAVDTTLLNGSVVTVLNNLTLDGATVRLERTQNAFQTTHDVQLNFSGGSQTLGGTGDVELYSIYNNIDPRYVQVRPTNGGELTIGSGITVRNAANSQFTTLGEPTLPLTIEGTVSAESSAATLLVTGTSVTNLGTLQALAGELDVDNLLGDVNGTNANGGDVDLDGVYTFNIPADVVSGSLTLRGEWTNASTISQQAGTIHLGGDFTIEDLGADVPTNFSGTGGLVSIFGALSAGVNDTLLINSERTWQLSGGTITEITIADDGNGDPPAAFRVTSADGILDGVTLAVDTTLLNGSVVTVLNDLTLDDITLRLERTLNNFNTSNDVQLNFSGGMQTLGGTGDVELYSIYNNIDFRYVQVRPTNGGDLTIGSGITVRNAANSQFTTLGEPTLPLTIEGTVSAESSAATLLVTGTSVTNLGTLQALAGELDVDNLLGDVNGTNANGGDVDLDGVYTFNIPADVVSGSLTLRGEWTNASTISQQGGTINLGGDFTIEDLGADVPTNFTGTGGLVSIFGSLSAGVSDTLLINSERTWQLSGGTITGITIADDGNGDPPAAFRVTSADGTLDGVTLAVDTTLLNGSVVTVLNDLTLDDITLRLERTLNNFNTSNDVQLNFSGGMQTLGGTGDVELYSIYNNIDFRYVQVRPTNGGELTIGSGITVRNAANSQFTTLGEPTLPLTIEGTVSAESSAATLLVTGTSVTNLGTLQALAGELDVDNLLGDVNGTSIDGGDLDLDGSYSFNLPVDVVSGSMTLRGDWTNASTISQQSGTIHLGSDFTIDDLGADVPMNFTGTGGIVSIFGSLSPGVNDTLLINSERTWQLSGGTITGITIADDDNGDPPAAFRVTSADGTLDGVTLGVDTTLLNGSVVTVLNNLTLDNAKVRLERTLSQFHESNDVQLNFSGGMQTLGGTGEVELYSVYNNIDPRYVQVRPTNGGELTIGSGITVRNAANSRFTTLGEPTLPLTIEGTVSAESSAATLLVTGTSVTNLGTLQALAGELDVDNLLGDVNGTSIDGGDLDLDGSYSFNLPVDVVSGSMTLRGDWTNASTISQQSGTIHLGSDFTIDDLGADVPMNFTGTGGIVSIFGSLSPGVNDTLLINSERTWQLSGGSITGITIADDDNGDPPAAFRVTSADGTLDGVTLGVDTTLLNGSVVAVLNNLTLDNAKVRLERTLSQFHESNDVQLNFSGGMQTLGGTGEVELYSVYNNIDPRYVQVRPTNGGELTIGSGITVRNAANSRFTTLGEPTLPLTIEGTVSAESPGETLRVTGTNVTNLGTLQALPSSFLDINDSLAIDSSGHLAGPEGGTVLIGNSLLGDSTNAAGFAPEGTVRLDGSGTAASPQLLEAMSHDLGRTLAGFDDNFAFGTLALSNGTYLQLVDLHDNAGGGGAEAVYTLSVIVPAGTTLDLNGLNLYTAAAVVNGTVIGGTITRIPVSPNLFYNDSLFDGHDPTATPADDMAIASDKQPLSPGQTATSMNLTGYVGGINGVMIDIARVPNPAGVDPTDFTFRVGRADDTSTWQTLSITPTIDVREDAGLGGSDRVTIIWPARTIVNQWLEVTVVPSADTGQVEADVFYFGNQIGDTNGDGLTNAADFAAVRANPSTFLQPAAIENPYDLNRDGRVNATDLAIVREYATSLGEGLPIITPTSFVGKSLLSSEREKRIKTTEKEGQAIRAVPIQADDETPRVAALLGTLVEKHELDSVVLSEPKLDPQGDLIGAALEEILRFRILHSEQDASTLKRSGRLHDLALSGAEL